MRGKRDPEILSNVRANVRARRSCKSARSRELGVVTEMLRTNSEQVAADARAPPVVEVWLPSETLAADVVVLLTGVLVFVVSVSYLTGK
jgi:hypothetical protein